MVAVSAATLPWRQCAGLVAARAGSSSGLSCFCLVPHMRFFLFGDCCAFGNFLVRVLLDAAADVAAVADLSQHAFSASQAPIPLNSFKHVVHDRTALQGTRGLLGSHLSTYFLHDGLVQKERGPLLVLRPQPPLSGWQM